MDVVIIIVCILLYFAAFVFMGKLLLFLFRVLYLRRLYKAKVPKLAEKIAKYTFIERITLNNAPRLSKRDFEYPETFFLHVLTLYDDVRCTLKAESTWKRRLFFYENLYINCRYALLNRFFMIPCPNDDIYKISPQIRSIIEEKCQMADPLSNDDMRSFYFKNPTAWEYRYNHLKKNFTTAGAEAFFEGIRCLGDHLTAITTIRKIYYEMHEKIIKHDRVLSLRFYLLYYYNALKLSKPLRIKRVNRKLLFSDDRQQRQFEKLCEEVKMDKNRLDEVLGKIASIYVRERKKLSLDIDGIKEADQKQARIAETLGVYLAVEEIPDANGCSMQLQHDAPKGLPQGVADTAMELIALFKCNDFNLEKQKVNIFAQSKGIMPGQLVESLNEKYYDTLDDVLIEEGDSCYTIEREYYEQIKEKNGS